MLDHVRIHLEALQSTANALERVPDVLLMPPTKTSPIRSPHVFRRNVERVVGSGSATVSRDRQAAREASMSVSLPPGPEDAGGDLFR